MEGLIAPGDSGGGLFITTSTGTYLAGINSFVGSDFGLPHAVYGNFSGHTRVSAFSDWIEARIRGEDPVLADSRQDDKTSFAKNDGLSGPGTWIIGPACRCRRDAGHIALLAPPPGSAVERLWNLGVGA